MATPKDKQELVLNPITGEFDVVKTFNADRIITHSLAANGNSLQIQDAASGQFMELGPLIVTDENGNVVVV